MGKRQGAVRLCASLALVFCACDTTTHDDDFDWEFRNSGGSNQTDQGSSGSSGGSTDGGRDAEADPDRPDDDNWFNNGLYDPDISGVDPAFALNTDGGLDPNDGLLTDPNKLGTVEYLVECALEEGTSITKSVGGQTHTFHGLIGLAPEWETGACDVDCQQWVTACLLARTNVSETPVTLWIQSNHSVIGFGSPGVPILHEATFYGNIFADPNAQFYCKGEPSGPAAAMRAGRTCVQGQGDCGFTKYAHCDMGRCALGGGGGDVPFDCTSDEAGNPVYHSISTYIES